MSKPYLPPPETTVHLIGDLHMGGISPHRCQTVLDDLDKEMVHYGGARTAW